jgi:hypothetical protein
MRENLIALEGVGKGTSKTNGIQTTPKTICLNNYSNLLAAGTLGGKPRPSRLPYVATLGAMGNLFLKRHFQDLFSKKEKNL